MASDTRIFDGLPAEYQQVMSPSGNAAQEVDPARQERLPTGVSPEARRTPADESAYARDRRGSSSCSSFAGGSGGDSAGTHDGVRGTASDGRTDKRAPGIAGGSVRSERDAQTGGRVPSTVQDSFLSPVTQADVRDPALFPHGGATQQTATSGLLLPSPFPSPTSQTVAAAETPSGLNLVQHGAAAMKWVAKLGEFVQRRAAYVTQPRLGEHTTVMQEQTVWSPTASRNVAQGETEPLFDRGQVRRLQELTAGAPHLYGAVQWEVGQSLRRLIPRTSWSRRFAGKWSKPWIDKKGFSKRTNVCGWSSRSSEESRLRQVKEAWAIDLVILLEVGEMVESEMDEINEVSKATQQDFLDMTVSKGVLLFSVRMIMNPGEILEVKMKFATMCLKEFLVYFVDMAEVGEKNVLPTFEGCFRAIHQEYLFEIGLVKEPFTGGFNPCVQGIVGGTAVPGVLEGEFLWEKQSLLRMLWRRCHKGLRSYNLLWLCKWASVLRNPKLFVRAHREQSSRNYKKQTRWLL
ncbi:unnamed protein product [Symbiodinium microadriaticum]|nr:unnamed protein product [Symbiodinium microadriaticum]